MPADIQWDTVRAPELETEDNLVACAKNYAEACQVKGTQERYIKSVQNFLKDMSFEAYLRT